MSEAYSAGTIFLQVVPVFRHAQEKVTAYAKGISKAMGEELNDGGRDAGEQFNKGFEDEVKKGGKKAAESHVSEFQKQYDRSVADMQKNLKTIEPKFENNEARRQIRELKADIDALHGKKIKTEADVREAVANIRILEAQLGGLPELVSTRAKFEATQAMKDASKFVAFVESIDGKDIEIEVRVDDKDIARATRNLGAFEKKVRETARKAADSLGDPINREIKHIQEELRGISVADIHMGLNDDVVLAKLDRLQARLYSLSKNDVDIQTKVDTGRAFAELFVLKRYVTELDGKNIEMKVDVDSRSALARLRGLAQNSQGTANAFRAFNAVILAALTLIPALIPVIAALGGALLALGPILAGLGGGLAAVVIGFSGIANAVQALNQRSQTAAKDTVTQTAQIKSAWYGVVDARQAVADAERSAAQSAADGARAVADARRSAAEAIRSALEQQRQAQEAYKGSVDDVRDAEQALRDAREQAKKDEEDLKDRIKDNRLAIRQGVLNAFDATNNLNAVMADGSSTAYDKEQAKIQHAQALQQLHELREEQDQLAKDQKRNRKEGIDGNDAVQTAQDQLTAAIQAQQDALHNLGDADRNVARTRVENARNIEDALRAQHRTDADGRRAVARAQEQLRRAQENYNTALTKTDDIGSSAEQNVKQAMAVLGPAGREFARFIFSLRKPFYELRDDIQAVMLPPIERAIKSIINRYGPQLHDFLVTMGRGFGRFVSQFAKSLSGPEWQGFFRMLGRFGPRFAAMFGKDVIVWLKIFARLLTITAPWALKLSKAMLAISEGILRWINSKKGTKVITDFMDYAARVGPTVVKFLVDLIGAAINLARALAPWGEVVLKALDGVLAFIKNMDPGTLGLIASGIIALAIAFQVATGVMALWGGALAILASSIGLVAFGVALLVAVIVVLAVRFKAVRNVLGFIAKLFGILIDYTIWYYTSLAKLVTGLVKFVSHNRIVRAVVGAVWRFIQHAFETGGKIIMSILRSVGDVVNWLWDNVFKPVFGFIGDIVEWLWKHIIRPSLGAIWGAFRTLGHIIRKVWNSFLFPIFDLFAHVFLALWKKVLKPGIENIDNLFRWLGRGFRSVWRNFIKPPLDDFGDAMNWLWKHVFKPVVGFIADLWHREMRGLKEIYDRFIKPMIDAFIDAMGGPEGLRSKFHTVVDALKTMWEGLKKVFAAPIKFVLDTVINHGIVDGFNKIANFVGSKEMAHIPIPKAIMNAYATGGVLPGYFPGGDNHHFFSPTAGRLDLSGGEAIMRPEFTKALGTGAINALNQAARNGGEGAVKKMLNAGAGHFFSSGGIFGRTSFAAGGALRNPDQKVYMDGKAIAAIAAAQILLAEQLRHTNYYLMQGGFGGDHIAASGTSHNYPGVADVGRSGGVSFADQAALRKVAFAAWARNIPGAAYVGSGAHVHSASLLSPGTASSPQVYSSWPGHTDGLAGGPDYGPRPPWLSDLSSRLGGFDLSNIDAGGGGHHGFGLPGWLIDIAKNPVGWASGIVTKPIHAFWDKVGSSPMTREIAGIPAHLVKAIAQKAIDIIPGGHAIMTAAGFAFDKVTDVGHALGNAADNIGSAIGDAGSTVADVFGFRRGGVLPYNGTMKYDAGGYLPPGLTSVLNLTGRPEPVFTDEQLKSMRSGGSGFTYAPTFHEAYDAEDVLDDLEFTMRKIGRSGGDGPYAGVS